MLTIRVNNGRAVFPMAEGLKRFEMNRQKVFREIGQSLTVSVRQGIEAEREPGGGAWEPLSPATVRARKGDAHPILQRTGRLKKSIAMRLMDNGVIVGTNLLYAPIHQYGGEIRRGAGAVKLHFRRVRRGKNRGRTLFAESGKADFGMAARAHVIRIPARPYLFQRDGGIPEGWESTIVTILKKNLGY
ncbi:MAG TPA: phage virion morphogenesis protein [Candidatus Mailhella merdavium]|nr:phage virion morphogenesis protein [Candidatus Mailhella merdavium]